MKRIIILFFVLNISAFPQELLKGKVVNSTTGEPLYLANVSVNGQEGAATNEDGEFELNVNLNSGSYLTVSYVGYETITRLKKKKQT